MAFQGSGHADNRRGGEGQRPAKKFLTPDGGGFDKSPSLHKLPQQSSTETSGLGETLTSGFSSQESIRSTQSFTGERSTCDVIVAPTDQCRSGTTPKVFSPRVTMKGATDKKPLILTDQSVSDGVRMGRACRLRQIALPTKTLTSCLKTHRLLKAVTVDYRWRTSIRTGTEEVPKRVTVPPKGARFEATKTENSLAKIWSLNGRNGQKRGGPPRKGDSSPQRMSPPRRDQPPRSKKPYWRALNSCTRTWKSTTFLRKTSITYNVTGNNDMRHITWSRNQKRVRDTRMSILGFCWPRNSGPSCPISGNTAPSHVPDMWPCFLDLRPPFSWSQASAAIGLSTPSWQVCIKPGDSLK